MTVGTNTGKEMQDAMMSQQLHDTRQLTMSINNGQGRYSPFILRFRPIFIGGRYVFFLFFLPHPSYLFIIV